MSYRPSKEKFTTQHIESTTTGTAIDHHDHLSQESESKLHDYYTKYPNRWAWIRQHYLREAASELLGTMVLIIFGAGVDCQVVLSGNTGVASSAKGDYLSISFGWAIGTSLGVWVASSSGGHINPVVTLVQAIFRGFPWKKVPVYILSQIVGGCIGGLLVYGNYFHAIDIFEGGPHIRTQATASLFTTYALNYLPSVACFFSEFLATAILLIVVLAITDKANGPPPAGLVPLVLFILVLGEGACLGMQTAYAMNPARDLGPRIALAMVGYPKEVLFDYRSQYWLWTPILGPLAGGMVGAVVYDGFLFTGNESIFNKPNAAAKSFHARAQDKSRKVVGRGPESSEDDARSTPEEMV